MDEPKRPKGGDPIHFNDRKGAITGVYEDYATVLWLGPGPAVWRTDGFYLSELSLVEGIWKVNR